MAPDRRGRLRAVRRCCRVLFRNALRVRPGARRRGDGAGRARGHHGPATAGALACRARAGRSSASRCTRCCTSTPSIVALLGAGAMLLVADVDVAEVLRGGRVADAGVLHGPVRHGRRPGPDRRHRTARRRWPSATFGDNYFARRHRAAVRVGGPRRDRRQHPLRRHDGPGRRGPGGAGTRRRKPGRRCGGRSRSAPTSAATPPRSGPAPTSSSSASPQRNGHPISFWQFTRYGIIVTLLSTALAWVYVWLRYF